MRLTDQDVKHKISEIISGKRLYHLQCDEMNEVFIFAMPSQQSKLKADLVYDAEMVRARREDIPTRRGMEKLLVDQKVISERDYNRINTLESSLKTLKLMHSRTRSQKQLTETQNRIKVTEMMLTNIRHQHEKYMFHTAEAKAEQAKTVYLIRLGVLNLDENPFWNSLEEFKRDERQEAQADLIREYLNFARGFETKTLRFIARNREWRIYWTSAIKTGSPLFDGSVTSWDINKLLICYWSNYYESIITHPQAPAEEIIDDDFKCDQWVEDQMRQVQSTGEGDISQSTQGGRTKVTHNINEPYRVVTEKEYIAEQAEKAKIEARQ